MTKIIVFDQSRCTYCQLCTLYCSLAFNKDGIVEFRPAQARIQVAQNEDDTKYAAHVCIQCEEATCMSACPVEGCITRNPNTGVVEINEDLCIGCGKCVKACEYGAIFMVDGKAVKCEVCDDPLCVKACAMQALSLEEPNEKYISEIKKLYVEVPL